MFNVKIGKTDFYKLHKIDSRNLANAFFKGEIEFNYNLVIEFYKNNKNFNNIYQKIYEDLIAYDIYYEPQTFNEKLITEEFFLPFSFENKNLIALCSDINDGWFHTYKMQLERYAQIVTGKSTKGYNDKVVHLNSYR